MAFSLFFDLNFFPGQVAAAAAAAAAAPKRVEVEGVDLKLEAC